MNSEPRRHSTGLPLVLYGVAILCAPAMHPHDGWAGGAAETAAVAGSSSATRVGAAHDDCPICHFLTHAYPGPERGPYLPDRAAEDAVGPAGRLVGPRAPRGVARPRAPPPA